MSRRRGSGGGANPPNPNNQLGIVVVFPQTGSLVKNGQFWEITVEVHLSSAPNGVVGVIFAIQGEQGPYYQLAHQNNTIKLESLQLDFNQPVTVEAKVIASGKFHQAVMPKRMITGYRPVQAKTPLPTITVDVSPGETINGVTAKLWTANQAGTVSGKKTLKVRALEAEMTIRGKVFAPNSPALIEVKDGLAHFDVEVSAITTVRFTNMVTCESAEAVLWRS